MIKRKNEHLRICIEEDVESQDPGFTSLRLKSLACPEINLEDVDTNVTFLGKKLKFPLIFEAITGGTAEAGEINKCLAKVAQDYGLGLGVGSQRAGLEDEKVTKTFMVRDVAPDILLIGNLGAVQLNYGYGLKECQKAVEMIGADALALHLNALQEAVQPEGDTKFRGIIDKINKIASTLKTPVIVKEVGHGLDYATAKKLKVTAYDCAGAGGTSWSIVESYRNIGPMGGVGVTFSRSGIPTAKCISELSKLKKPIIGSGGIRSGLDAAKAIALGADVVGVALPLLRAYDKGGEDAVKEYVDKFIAEFRTAMYITGSKKVRELRGKVE